ncbi:MAG: hypothetical protein ACRD1R_11295 [Acidobacteriota bacterium]
MNRRQSIQYTIRAVPARVDRELRRRARQEEKSLNEVSIEALTRGIGLAEERPRFHDLDQLAGSWVEDSEFEKAIEEQDQIDPSLWK